MANKTFNTRLKLKYDTYEQWNEKNPILLAGEIAVCVVPAGSNQATNEPTVLLKCGDGSKHFNDLGWISGLGADVYSWAKESKKPTYAASEITGLSDYISGEIQDTDTQYKIEADAGNARKFYLYSKSLDGSWGATPVSTIEIPETVYTLSTGSANGTVSFNGADVAVKGLGSAAYTNADAYDASGSAQTAEDNAKKYADGKDAAITAAKSAADNAQADVDALEAKVGTVPADKTIVQMISEAQTAATYDDTALKNRVSATETAIDTLNGTGAGSVSKQVADAVAGIVADAPEAYNTLKEISDWISNHSNDASAMNTQINANKSAIETLNGSNTTAGSVAKAVKDAQDALQANIDTKVDKVSGKGLSTNDYTTEEKNKLSGIAAGAQVNVIETVKVNGVALTPSSKAVNVSVPTGALASKDVVAEGDLADALATKINGKLDASAVTGDLLTHNASEFAVSGHNHDTVYSKLDHNHKIEELNQTDYIIFDCGTASTII